MSDGPMIWKTHKRRPDFSACPHCGQALKWIYSTDGEWIPCDPSPVLFMLHPRGTKSIVYDRKIFDCGVIYRSGDNRFQGQPLQGHQQHYYTCQVLTQHRKDYVKRNYGQP